METPTATSDLDHADDVDILAGKAIARARSGGRLYELNPGMGESKELTWFIGTPLLQPESGESWGIIKRDDGQLEIVDFDTHQPVLLLPSRPENLLGFRQFPDKRRTVLLYADKTIDVWDTVDRRLAKHVNTPELAYVAKASPNGRWLATVYTGPRLSIWDTTTWTERPLPRVGGGAQNVMFSPDGTRLLASTFKDNVEVWDVQAGRLVGTLTGHSQSVEDAAYSPDQKRIVTASDDGTVRIWDATTFRELSSLAGHNRFVLRARFTDDGTSIISIDDKGNAKLWLTKTLPGLVSSTQ